MPDQQPDWVAQLDQMRAALTDTARTLHAYYAGLIEAGFNPEQALALTSQFQGLVFAAGMLNHQSQQGE